MEHFGSRWLAPPAPADFIHLKSHVEAVALTPRAALFEAGQTLEGVPRRSVTIVARTLQNAGLIRDSRGGSRLRMGTQYLTLQVFRAVAIIRDVDTNDPVVLFGGAGMDGGLTADNATFHGSTIRVS